MTTIHPIGPTGLDALYFEMDQLEDQNRKAARETRHAAEGLQIHALREQADHVQEAALLAGLGQGVGGACSMAGAAAKGIAFGLSDTSTAESAAAARQTADSVGAAFVTIGQMAGGAFEGLSGAEDAAALRRAAQATAAESSAADAKQVEQDCEKAQDQLVRNLETAQQIRRDLLSALVRA